MYKTDLVWESFDTLCSAVLPTALGLRDPKRVEYGVNRGESRASSVSVRCYGRAVQIEITEGPQRTCWPPYMFMYYYYVNLFLLLCVCSVLCILFHCVVLCIVCV